MKTPKNLPFKNWLLVTLLKSQNRNSSSEKGYVLVVAIAIILGVSGLLALYAKTSKVQQNSATAGIDSSSGFYGAEAGLNLRANKLRDKFLNYQRPNGTSPTSATACFDDNSSNDGTEDYACDKLELAAGSTNRSKNSVTTYVIGEGEGVKGIVPQGDLFQGLSMVEFTHSIYSLAFKDANTASDEGKQATAILQMDLKSRTVPMFQFAAFYTEDLEIFPSPPMTLNGPVHTNGNLHLGSSNTLELKGQVSTVKNIFQSRKNNSETFPDGRVKIATATNTLLNLLFNGTGSTTQTTNFMDPVRIAAKWGSQIKVRTNAPVSIPTASILNNEGDYYIKGDLRIEYKPVATSTATLTATSPLLTTVPFAITAIDRTNINSPVERNLTTEQLKSLRQPVMVRADIAKIPASTPLVAPITSSYATFHACVPDTTLPTTVIPSGLTVNLGDWWNKTTGTLPLGLTTAQKNAFRLVAQDYLQTQIQSQNVPVRFSLLSQSMSTINSNALYNNFAPTTTPTSFSNDPRLTAQFTTTTSRDNAWKYLREMTPQDIAGLQEYTGSGQGTAVTDTARCFVSAPITDIGRDAATHKSFTRFYNERENRDMRILQLNIQSLALWNDHGFYWDGTNLVSAQELLYEQAPADSTAPVNSFQRLGLAAKDVSEGGMVIHGTIDGDIYPLANGDQSPYGFALTQGKQLLGLGKTTNQTDPTGLTVATDQGLYVQGDYNVGQKDFHTGFPADLATPTPAGNNRVHNKQPAAFLADTFYPLSNTCFNQDQSINHFTNVNCDNGIGDSGSKKAPSHTEKNAAILSGTDISGSPGAYNGGLENYPRFLENWSSKEWRYKGSFVSVDTPQHARGPWGGGDVYSPPLRPWDYDTEFNDARNLPPLTPQFVYIKQDSFIRSFDQ
jgi:Tfp pilus assembly protein PilX